MRRVRRGEDGENGFRGAVQRCVAADGQTSAFEAASQARLWAHGVQKWQVEYGGYIGRAEATRRWTANSQGHVRVSVDQVGCDRFGGGGGAQGGRDDHDDQIGGIEELVGVGAAVVGEVADEEIACGAG